MALNTNRGWGHPDYSLTSPKRLLPPSDEHAERRQRQMTKFFHLARIGEGAQQGLGALALLAKIHRLWAAGIVECDEHRANLRRGAQESEHVVIPLADVVVIAIAQFRVVFAQAQHRLVEAQD